MKTSEYVQDPRRLLGVLETAWRNTPGEQNTRTAEIAALVLALANDFLYINQRQFYAVLSCIKVAVTAREESHQAAMRIAKYINTCR